MEELKKAFFEDIEKQTEKNAVWIKDGHENNPDSGIKYYSTARRWEQYTAGAIDREKAVNFATKRMIKDMDKKRAAGLEKIEAAENAPDITRIYIGVEWTRSRTWGFNPTAEQTNSHETRRTFGSASGCGYDKESAAVAEALNASPAVRKVLYSLKNDAIKEGKSDESATACTGHDNRYSIGYGAGYSVIPYFEGGVGVSCFWDILKKAGFTTEGHHGKHYDSYILTRS